MILQHKWWTTTNNTTNQPRDQITNQVAAKISEDYRNFILDEIIRREALEYDHSLVFAGDDAEEENWKNAAEKTIVFWNSEKVMRKKFELKKNLL